jgi:hypothetical protein
MIPRNELIEKKRKKGKEEERERERERVCRVSIKQIVDPIYLSNNRSNRIGSKRE